jgi:nucleoid DNA-binding protein
MRKRELVSRIAESGNTSPAEAADQLDRLVHDTLVRLRKGKCAVWPGFGSFEPEAEEGIRFAPADTKGGKA